MEMPNNEAGTTASLKFRSRGGGTHIDGGGFDDLRNQSVLNLNIDRSANSKRPPARRSVSKLLTLLYAIAVVLMGFMLPLTEALRNRWHESVYHLLFQIYIFAIAVVFLLYLQLRLIPLSLKKQRKLEDFENYKSQPRASIRRSATGLNLYDVTNSSQPSNGLSYSETNGKVSNNVVSYVGDVQNNRAQTSNGFNYTEQTRKLCKDVVSGVGDDRSIRDIPYQPSKELNYSEQNGKLSNRAGLYVGDVPNSRIGYRSRRSSGGGVTGSTAIRLSASTPNFINYNYSRRNGVSMTSPGEIQETITSSPRNNDAIFMLSSRENDVNIASTLRNNDVIFKTSPKDNDATITSSSREIEQLDEDREGSEDAESIESNQKEGYESGNEEDDIFIDLSVLGNAFSHHGSNLYLRLGALIFSLCNMVYVGLELENGIRMWLEKDCEGVSHWWIFLFRLAFLLVQSFLIFKNISVEIRVQQPLARFGFMHLIATNMCVWLHTIMNEIMEEYHLELTHGSSENHNHTDTGNSALPIDHTTRIARHAVILGSASSNADRGFKNLPYVVTTETASKDDCQYFTGILEGAAPYLFPFVLEYSLIAIGTVAFMLSSICESDSNNNMLRGLHNWIQVQDVEWIPSSTSTGEGEDSNSHRASQGGVELKKSHRGMFAGILLLAGNLITVFLFYFMIDYQDLIYYSTELITHTFLLIATLIALYKLSDLSFIEKSISIDDVFLTIAMSGSFLFEITLILSSFSYLGDNPETSDLLYSVEIIKLASALVAAVQTLAQTVLVVSGLRRYPNKERHVKEMPGRGTITFLIIGNVVVWISRTLQSKQVSYATERDFYGLLAALLLLDTNLPLLLYFRFHSSVCLADIWASAYTAVQKKIQHHQHRHHDTKKSKLGQQLDKTDTGVNRRKLSRMDSGVSTTSDSVYIDTNGNWGVARNMRRTSGSSLKTREFRSASWGGHQSLDNPLGSRNPPLFHTLSEPEGSASFRNRIRSPSGDNKTSGVSSMYSDIIHEVDETSTAAAIDKLSLEKICATNL